MKYPGLPIPAYDLFSDGYFINNVRFLDQNQTPYFFALGRVYDHLIAKEITLHEAAGDGDKTYLQIEWSDGTIVNYYSFDEIQWLKKEEK
jgi:hypothetical protein